MNNLIIGKTNNTPAVVFDIAKKELMFSGKSLPENAIDFYNVIEDYLKEYIRSFNDKLTIICDLEYINSASNKKLFQIFKNTINGVNEIKIIWMYDSDDDDMKEQGEDFEHALGIKFEFISKEQMLDSSNG